MRAIWALLACLTVLAGCASGGTSTPVRAAGSVPTVDPAAVESAGYEHHRTANRTLNATVSVTVEGDIEAQESQDVAATIPVAVYRRSTAAGPAVVAVAASPSVQVLENPPMSADPLETLSTAELVGFVQSAYGEPTDLRKLETTSVQLLDVETDLVTHEGRTGEESQRVTVRVARAESSDEMITVVAVHPASVTESDRVRTVIGGVTH